MSDLFTRSFEFRSDEEETGVVEGRAVPYETPAQIGDYTEVIAKHAVMARDDIKLFNQHREVIGKVIESRSEDDGFYIKAKISDIPAGRDVLTLLRDGVVNKFSIGFKPVEDEVDNAGNVRRIKIDVREVSTVAIPAYDTADILSVRSEMETVVASAAAPTNERDEDVTDVNITAADLDEVRGAVEDLDRRMALLNTNPVKTESVCKYRDAADLLKAMVNGDETAAAEYRVYTGGTSADNLVSDVLKNVFTGDLTKIVEDATVLDGFFSKSTLPSVGNHVEYGRFTISSISVAATGVGEQAAEGDDLLRMANLKYDTDTAAVKTVGGYFELSRQDVERSPQSVLAAHQRVQAIALGKDRESRVRTAFNAARSANSGSAITVTDGDDWPAWQSAIIDAAILYKGLGFADFSLIVGKTVFKRLAAMSDLTTGKPVLDQNAGAVNVRSLTGQVFSVPVILDALGSDTNATFAVPDAIRVYSNGVTKLQDANVVNLSSTWSLYQYIAVAPEHAYLVIPVTISA